MVEEIFCGAALLLLLLYFLNSKRIRVSGFLENCRIRVSISFRYRYTYPYPCNLDSGLDGTARALRRDARLAGLWRRLSDDLCRGALVDMCRRSGVALEPTFMSLPGDAKAAVLARLASGADLASVERVCTGLRRLVAERDRQLWKPRYDAFALRAAS